MFHTYRKALVSIVLVFCLFSIVSAYSGGTGEPNDPYQIGTVSDWQELMSEPNDWNKNFIMIADVNLQGVALTPVGNYIGYSGIMFTGVFDGNSHIISNAEINRPIGNYVGLFGYVGAGSGIHNLGVADVNMTGNLFTGGLAGCNQGTITNCYVTGTIIGGDAYTGGLAGYNSYQGTISNCHSAATIYGNGNSDGGLAGRNAGFITNCYAVGTVSGHRYVGGLVGDNTVVKVVPDPNCYYGTITSCHAAGTVTATGDYIGGLVGRNNGGCISDCYAEGSVTGDSYIGGLIGYYSPLINPGNGCPSCPCSKTIAGCYATGTVTGTGSVVNGLTCFVGGLIGACSSGVYITNSHATGDVIGSGDDSYTYNCVGGLVGQGGNISNCYATGAVTASGGGNGTIMVGGLVGGGGHITNSYATGAVTLIESTCQRGYIGGLLGFGIGLGITKSYAVGKVTESGNTGSIDIGGLIGGWGSADDTCFWDIETSGQTNNSGGEGKTTAEMKTRSTFTSAGWDFCGETANGTEDIWAMCQGISYPKFTWQNQPPIANAGPDQTIYAWIDGVAEAELDGLDSNDPDCNELTYFWNWTIDGITFEANDVNPIIELPVGVHTIQLIVNDGIVDSVPDDVNITVIAPLKSKLQITPCVLNRDTCNRHKHHHKPEKILAIIRLPEGIARKDIDNTELLTIYPGGIKAQRQWILPYYEGDRRHRKLLTAIWAYFDRDDILDAIPANGKVELKAAGKLKTGQYFYGSDTVRIIAPPPPPPPRHFPRK